MSIENHKWSDVGVSVLSSSDKRLSIHNYDTVTELNKQDAIAVAKHFDVDREYLMSEVKGVLDEVERAASYGGVSDGYYTAIAHLKNILIEV